MGNLINAIIALLILIIVSAVCSTFFYKKGQEQGWELAQQLVPLEKGEIYLAVEREGAKGVSYLTVQTLSKAVKDKNHDQRELRFRMNLARDGVSLQEYNDKYRGGKKGM
ncbi:MAG: hypothetical protein RQ722_00295 [Desulfuromonadales bacterium]|nr:hypothetical protein [Desulfuromonadales bacterium]